MMEYSKKYDVSEIILILNPFGRNEGEECEFLKILKTTSPILPFEVLSCAFYGGKLY